jgi:hypothetical protein
MICTSAGSPAIVRSSQSRQWFTTSRKPFFTITEMVREASRSQT